jgi:hypothetical protein
MRRAKLEGRHIGRNALVLDRAAILRDRQQGHSLASWRRATWSAAPHPTPCSSTKSPLVQKGCRDRPPKPHGIKDRIRFPLRRQSSPTPRLKTDWPFAETAAIGVPGRHQYDWSPHSCTGRVRSESGFSENRINNLADLGTFPHRGVVEIQGLGEKLSLELSNLRNIDWRKIAEALIDIGLVPGSRHRDWNLITESGIEGRRRNARLAGPILLSVPKTSSMSALGCYRRLRANVQWSVNRTQSRCRRETISL